MQIEKNIYLTKRETQEIKENKREFIRELSFKIEEKLLEIYNKSDKIKSRYIYVLISSRNKNIVKEIPLTDDLELMTEVELKYIIFHSKPWPFLNTMCVKIDTFTGQFTLESSLPPLPVYKQLIMGKLNTTNPIIMRSCEEFKRFREEHGAIPMSTHEKVNSVDWEEVERLMEEEVRHRIVIEESEEKKTTNP